MATIETRDMIAEYIAPEHLNVTDDQAGEILLEPIYVDAFHGSVLLKYEDVQWFADDYFGGDFDRAAEAVIASKLQSPEELLFVGDRNAHIYTYPDPESRGRCIDIAEYREATFLVSTVAGEIPYAGYHAIADAQDLDIEVVIAMVFGNLMARPASPEEMIEADE